MGVIVLADANSDMLDQILSGVDADTINQTALTPAQFSKPMADLATKIGRTAVAPVAVAVLCIVVAIELNRAVLTFDAHGEALARLQFAAIMKFVVVAYLATHATTLVNGISTIADWMNSKVQTIKPSPAQSSSTAALKAALDGIGGWDLFKKVKIFVLLLIPFLISQFVRIGIRVAIVVIFFTIYMLSAFAALPAAFFASEETKQLGIGYLKAYASACLRLLFLYIGLLLYRMWMAAGGAGFPAFKAGDDVDGWLIKNWGYLIMGSLVLGCLIVLSQSAARAVVGD